MGMLNDSQQWIKEIRDSMSIPKQKRKKGKQEKLFEVKVKSSNLPGSR